MLRCCWPRGGYADLRGRKKSMLIGLMIFAVASVTCGLATDSLMLNLSRAAQGVGGAFLLTASSAILSNAFTGAERNQAFAFWGASLGIALAVGPIIGGAITNFVGWRWAFLVNVPASAVLILATLKFIGESRDPNAKRLDIFGYRHVQRRSCTTDMGAHRWQRGGLGKFVDRHAPCRCVRLPCDLPDP
jgi:MFS family permease